MFDTISQLAAEWLLPGVFFWLVVCLAATNIQEWIATRLEYLARKLENAIQNMLGDNELTQKFYNHLLLKTTRVQSQETGKQQFTPIFC
jgi:lipopolysaccharide export LptBFGC system permease protein LptF